MKPSKAKKNGKRKKRNPSAPPPQGCTAAAGDDPQEKKEGGGGEVEDEDGITLNWLADAFSSSSLEEVNSAYREAQGDPFKAAAILGTFSADPQIGSPADGKKKCAGIRKQKKVVTSAGLVSDVIGKEYGRSAAGDFRRRSDSRGPKGPGKQPYGHEEAQDFLCSMLGDGCELDPGVVRDVFGHCGYDVEKALDTLLDICASQNLFREKDSGDCRKNNLNYYSTIPTERSINDSAGDCMKNLKLMGKIPDSSNHPSEKEHEHQQSVGYGFRDPTKVLVCLEENSSSRSGTTKLDLQQKVLESLFNIPDTSKHELNCMNWKKVVKKVESFGQGLEFSYANIAEPLQKALNGKVDGYQVSRSAARQHWDAMKSYYQRAAVAYSKGERAHAGYLSEKGKHYSKLAREADAKASREIFEARNKDIQNTVTIDLHGQHVEQAIGLLKLHLLLFTYIPSIQFLRVIAGCGTHGVGKGKLKQSVIGLIEKEGIEWSEENVGTLVITLDGLKEYSFMTSESDSE